MSAAIHHILAPDFGDVVDVLGIRTLVKLSAAQTGGAYGLAELQVPPGLGVPLHVHAREDESFVVLAGALMLTCGGGECSVSAGATVFLPRGVPHCFHNVSNELCRLLVLITPGGFERFFAEIDGVADPAAVVAAGQRYGLTFPAPE